MAGMSQTFQKAIVDLCLSITYNENLTKNRMAIVGKKKPPILINSIQVIFVGLM